MCGTAPASAKHLIESKARHDEVKIRAMPGRRISSRNTFFLKKVFPLLWFVFLAFLVAIVVTVGARQRDFSFLVISLFTPLALAAFGFFFMKKFVWDLVDEVYDCGDFLQVRNRGEEDHVQLSNIMNVSVTSFMNPPRITLRLVNSGKFGSEISFSPIRKFTLNPFPKDPIAEDLIVRVDQARSRR